MKTRIPPPVLGLAAAVFMWLANKAAPGLAASFPAQKLLGGALIVAGLAFDVASIGLFVRKKTTVSPLDPGGAATLVTNGLYRFTRNPMYLGLLMILAGGAAILGNPVNVLVLAGFVFAVTELQIRPEEEALREKFGAAYEDYRQRVRRWI